MMGAPLAWLGASPVLVYNLLLLAGFTLTGWVTSLVVHRWTGDWTAGILAGSVMAFNAHSLTRLPHLHASHMEFLMLTLLALDRVLRQPTTGNALLLAVSFVLQALTSNYHMVFTLFALAAAVAVRPADWTGPRFRPAARALLIAGAVSAVCIFPFLLPCIGAWTMASRDRWRRSAHAHRLPGRLLSTAGRLHYAIWSEVHQSRRTRSFGFCRLTRPCDGSDDRPRLRAACVLAIGIVGFLLSFGTSLPGYSLSIGPSRCCRASAGRTAVTW